VKVTYLNLGCGNIFVNSTDWINFDWAPQDRDVKRANLIKKLPIEDETVDLIYSSHFIEHIPIDELGNFLKECYRILKKGGIIRLVLPDFENIAREYIRNIDKNNLKESQFNIIEMIDQCVRLKSGGALADIYSDTSLDIEFKQYISSRTGYNFNRDKTNRDRNTFFHKLTFSKTLFWLNSKYISFILLLLPRWYKKISIAKTEPGERHFWVHDFNSVSMHLLSSGYNKVYKVNCEYSHFENFPFFPLDVDNEGKVLKGNESMFIEAIK
jgi:predicted SAM-dependent methyltransferase